MGVPTKLVFYLVPILLMIAVVMVFWSQGGAWEDMKEIVTGMKDFVYDKIGFGTESLSADVSISAEHTAEINSLVSTIRSMQGKEKCFANFGGFSDLEERGTSISFELSGNNTQMVVMGGAGGTQIITDMIEDFEGMTPCVIAGSKEYQASNFYDHYIGGEELHALHYSDVSSIQFEYNDGGYMGFAANVIKIPELGIDNSNNFKSDGWMYTPDGSSFCFFPTTLTGTGSADGIGSKWFSEGIENSIFNLYYIQGNNVGACS